jgi:hypothetical protein
MGKDDGDDGAQRSRRPLRRLVVLAAVGLTVGAVVQELRKQPGDRTWTGRVAGVVPYDFRWPITGERVTAEWWDPENEAILTPHAFGVGWGVNLARVAQLAQTAIDTGRR